MGKNGYSKPYRSGNNIWDISACTLYEGISIAVIAFAHHKGGTGKTTTCLQVAGFLSKIGRRVLIIDTDPQANATLGLGIHPDTPARNIYHFYVEQSSLEEPIHLSDCIIRTVSGIDLVPSHLDLVGAEPMLYQYPERYEILVREIGLIKDRYDHILIDTPPFLGQYMINALIAADRNILVFSPDSFAMNGYENIRLILKDIDELLGKKIQIHCAVLNRWSSETVKPGLFDRFFAMIGKKPEEPLNPGDELKALLEGQIRRDIPHVILIPESKLVVASQKNGMPLAFSHPEDPAAIIFSRIADDLDMGR